MSPVTYEWVMSHMNESCHIWMSHVTYEWVMSHMNASCHIWMRHIMYEWVMSRINESCHIWMSHVTYEWVVSHIKESCHIWMSHVTYECIISYMCMEKMRLNLMLACMYYNIYINTTSYVLTPHMWYVWSILYVMWVATISRLLKITGLSCRISSLL